MDFPPANTAASLDSEIQRVREEISTLARQKSALTSAILSRATFTTRLLSATTTPDEKTRLNALIRAQEVDNVKEAHRFFTGVSTVDLADPKESAALPAQFRQLVERKDVLGLRFERFVQATRRFGSPVYVILEAVGGVGVDESVLDMSVRDLAGTKWRLLEHDLPSYVLVEEMVERYLDGDGDDRSEDEDSDEHLARASDRGLRTFARCVQKELMAGLRRHDAIRRLRANLPEGWQSVFAVSSDAKEVGIVWEDSRAGRMLLDGHGNVKDVVVTDQSGNRERSTEAELVAKKHLLAYVENVDDTFYGWAE